MLLFFSFYSRLSLSISLLHPRAAGSSGWSRTRLHRVRCVRLRQARVSAPAPASHTARRLGWSMSACSFYYTALSLCVGLIHFRAPLLISSPSFLSLSLSLSQHHPRSSVRADAASAGRSHHSDPVVQRHAHPASAIRQPRVHVRRAVRVHGRVCHTAHAQIEADTLIRGRADVAFQLLTHMLASDLLPALFSVGLRFEVDAPSGAAAGADAATCQLITPEWVDQQRQLQTERANGAAHAEDAHLPMEE